MRQAGKQLKHPDHHDISSIRALRFLVRRMLEHPRAFGAVVLFGLVAASSELLSIALLMPFVESLRGEGGSLSQQFPLVGFLSPYFEGLRLIDKIRLIAVALLGVELVKGCSRFISNVYSSRLQFRINSDLQMRVMDQLLAAGRGYLHRQKLSNVYTILNTYTYNTGFSVLSLASIVPDLFMIAISMVVLFTISAPLTLITLVLAAVVSVSLGRMSRLAQIYGRQNLQQQLFINQQGIEILNGMDVIRLFDRKGAVRKKYDELVQCLRITRCQQGFLTALLSPLTTVLLALTITLILVASTFFLQREAEFWIGILLVFLVVFARLGGPLAKINLSRSQLMTLFPAVLALEDFLISPEKENLSDGTEEFEELEREIRFDRVSFNYGKAENEVLREVSLAIPRGKTTAIVGGSGSGKSTLVALLGRLHEPTGGRILIDGRDLRQIRSASWHRRIGVVSQSIFLFNETIRDNIRFGRPEAGDEEVERAAVKANAHQFILEMPEGYDTVVGDRGVRLSGGQAQRVSIARALLVRPQLLILDEATSSLDSQSERLVQEAIQQISHEYTLLVVAHRLATVRQADNIVVLHEGQVVEQGTHQELIGRKGYYWQYAQLQNLDRDVPESDLNLSAAS